MAHFFANSMGTNGRANRSRSSNAKAHRSRKAAATKKRLQRSVNSWKDRLHVFDGFAAGIKNPPGRSRTFNENKLLLLALRAALRRQVQALEANKSEMTMSWTAIEEEVSTDFGVNRNHLTSLRKEFLDDGDVLVWSEDSARGGAAEGYDHSKNRKISPEILKSIAHFIDSEHALGRSVVNRAVRSWLLENHSISVGRSTVQRAMKRLGLQWQAIKPVKKTLNAYRLKAIRDFIIGLDKIHTAITNGNEEAYVFVFTDESYIHNSHAIKVSYLSSGDKSVNRSTGKGRRLILLHTL